MSVFRGRGRFLKKRSIRSRRTDRFMTYVMSAPRWYMPAANGADRWGM